MFPTASKRAFLRAIAERSTNRVVKGQATATLAAYLRKEASMASMFQDPNAPARLEDFLPEGDPDEARKQLPADLLALRRQSEEFYAKYQPGTLRRTSSRVRRRGAPPRVRPGRSTASSPTSPTSPTRGADGRPTRETLADAARQAPQPGPDRGTGPGPDTGPGPPGRPRWAFQALAEADKAAERKRQAAEHGRRRGAWPGVRAYMAAAAEAGVRLRPRDDGHRRGGARGAPRASTPSCGSRVRSSLPVLRRERGAGRARSARPFDTLDRDHLEDIDGHLDDRTVAEGFNHWSPIPGAPRSPDLP